MSVQSVTQPVITELKELCRVYKNKDGSKFYDIMTSGFKDSSRHYLSSSSDLAAAAIQPGSDASLAEVLQIIAKYRVPFAVKGGGHSMTPDFSSTSGGIQISMTRFDDITYNPTNFRLEVGAGALWGAVYQETAKHGRCVVGGANRAVGVAGFTLGGGYSLKTNRLGLGIDHVQGFRIVTPSGAILDVSDESTGDELELYQALRGGANNFGIVTSFTLNTHEQTSTYGAMLVIPGEKEPEVKQAILEHITTEKRKEAALECIFKYNLHPGQPSPQHTISAYCVFDAPKPQKLEDVPYKAFRDIVERSWEWKENPAGWDPVLAAVDATLFAAPPYSAERQVSVAGAHHVHDMGFREMSFEDLHVLSDHAFNVVPVGKEDLTSVPIEEASEPVSHSDHTSIPNDRQAPRLFGLMAKTQHGFGSLVANTEPTIIYQTPAPNTKPSLPAKKTLAEIVAELGCASNGGGVKLALYSAGTVPSGPLEVPADSEDDSEPIPVEEEEGDACEAEPEDSEVDGKVESERPDGAASEPAGLPQTPSKAPAPPPPFPVANLGETNMRGRFACIMVSGYTSALISAAAQEAKRASQLMSKHSGRQVAFDVWPFLPSLFDDSPPNAAWPHTPGHPYSPLIASFLWDDLKDDEFWLNEIRASLDTLMQVAVSEGVARADMPRYLNTSLEDVSVEMVYGGEENVRRLGRVRRKWDAGDVMSLTGGFRIPLAE